MNLLEINLLLKSYLSLKKNNPNIEYSCVGGTHLNSLGIKSIFDLKEITYIGFTSVLLNIFKIKNKINKTVEEIIKFNPDVLFTVDSPDFTLRVAEKVKKINNQIKTVHYVAPQVWVWREGRVKKFKKFLDHVLLLFGQSWCTFWTFYCRVALRFLFTFALKCRRSIFASLP